LGCHILARPQQIIENLEKFLFKNLNEKEVLIICLINGKETSSSLKRKINNFLRISKSSFYYILKNLEEKGLIKRISRKTTLTPLGMLAKEIFQKKLEKKYIAEMYTVKKNYE